MGFSPLTTRAGRLTPWELAKAWALSKVVQEMAKQHDQAPHEVVGQRVDKWIASQVFAKAAGGKAEHPTPRAVRAALARCEEDGWFPGKQPENLGGRKRVYSEHVFDEVARVAMELKGAKEKVTPRRVRARLCRLTRNPETGGAMSDYTLRSVFTSKCYDETEDDPWVFRKCLKEQYATLR